MNAQIDTQWYSRFFDGLIVDMQRCMYPPELTRLEADFLQRQFGLPPGSLIADLPCGDGRLAIALAKAGYGVQGLDISPDILETARQNAIAAKVAVEFREGDMQFLPWAGELDGAFCFGNSFAYFDETGNRGFLGEVYRALKPGGRFVLQTNLLAESIFARQPARSWYEFGDVLFMHAPAYDPVSGVLSSDYTLMRGGEREVKRAHYRVYRLREVADMLLASGFAGLRCFGGMNGEPFKLGDVSAYLVVDKP
ncbi:MAG TPA: class I SAM-dependent methyltransferase [Gammaproteobacteria bacterium]|nr:class I SAM-dependent methyltransferase [Gammaproteobacteria bacterium]